MPGSFISDVVRSSHVFVATAPAGAWGSASCKRRMQARVASRSRPLSPCVERETHEY